MQPNLHPTEQSNNKIYKKEKNLKKKIIKNISKAEANKKKETI